MDNLPGWKDNKKIIITLTVIVPEQIVLNTIITAPSLTYPVMGAVFGLTAGISPGPLLTLVITETLKYGKKEGIRIALAPLITDLPIILIAYFIFSRLARFNLILAIITFAGGAYLGYLAYETIRAKRIGAGYTEGSSASLKKGIAANFLNPNPYIFWFTAGIPTAFRAYESGLPAVILFFISFYTFLTGSKVAVAIIAERSRSLLSGRSFRILIRILGITLLIFAVLFFLQAGALLKKT